MITGIYLDYIMILYGSFYGEPSFRYDTPSRLPEYVVTLFLLED